jgi:hypothetical protein
VLHIIDMPGAGWDALAAAERCARTLDADQRLLLIGDKDAAADAAAFGLEADYRLCPPLNRLAAAVSPFDRLLKDASRSWPVDLVHVWSDSARVLCRETIGFDLPIVQEDPAPFVKTTVGREEARAALGIAPGEVALVLASDRAGVGDARRFTGMVGVLSLAEYNVVGVACTRSDTFRRAARFLRGFMHHWDVVPVSTPPHTSLAAADIVCYDQGDSLTADAGPGPRTGGVVFAAGALGIPVVTTPSPLSRRLLGPLAPDLITASGAMPEVSRLTLPLCSDAAHRAEVGGRLREQIASMPPPPLLERWLDAVARGAAA